MPADPRSSASRDPGVRILLVDDEEVSRLGLSAALRGARGITVVGATQIDAELYGPIRARHPHVVLVNTSTTGDWRAADRPSRACAAAKSTSTPRSSMPRAV